MLGVRGRLASVAYPFNYRFCLPPQSLSLHLQPPPERTPCRRSRALRSPLDASTSSSQRAAVRGGSSPPLLASASSSSQRERSIRSSGSQMCFRFLLFFLPIPRKPARISLFCRPQARCTRAMLASAGRPPRTPTKTRQGYKRAKICFAADFEDKQTVRLKLAILHSQGTGAKKQRTK
jgi:hypothetical protein